MIKNDFSLPSSEVFLPSEKSIKLTGTEEDISKKFSIKFKRDEKHDRLISFTLHAVDSTQKKRIDLQDRDTIYKIYVEPLIKDSLEDVSKRGYEFWLFTGTNLDLLDGVKARELYFKGSYLINIKKNKESTLHWAYLTFGKNRYFSDKDSIRNISFTEPIRNPSLRDSITVVNGFYSTATETATDNIFGSLDYLYETGLSSEQSKFFLDFGFYIGLQTARTRYSNFNIISDTNTYNISPDSIYRFHSIAKELTVRQFNSNVSLGFLHIFSTKKINVKSQFTAGLNVYTYPYRIELTSANQSASYKKSFNSYILMRIDATVLNPGISLGFETFLRAGKMPLFNISLTKVLDLEQLSSLFSPITTVKK